MKKYKKAVKVLLIISMFLLPMMVFSGNAHAWDVYVTWSPTHVYTGETVTFHMTVRNTGNNEMKIIKIGVRFDWMPSDYYYMVSANFPIYLKPDKIFSYQVTVPIPDNILTHTPHTIEVRIEAADPSVLGLWVPYSDTVSGSIYVTKPYYKVYGYIQDPSGNPIKDATIKIGDKTVTSSPNGYYSITVEKGTYTMSVEADNYKEYQTTIVVSGNLKKDITLQPLHTNVLSNIGNSGNNGYFTWGLFFFIIIVVVIITIILLRSSKKKSETNYSYTSSPEEEQENVEENLEIKSTHEEPLENDDIIGKLAKLKELYNEGLITEEEYDERRRKLLEDL